MKQIDNAVIDRLKADLRDAVFETGMKTVVLGVSGGIDSALSAALAAEALGKENVYGYSMPYRTSSQASRDDAAFLAEHIGISLETVDITAMAEAYPGYDSVGGHRLGNILARLRMIVLFDKSAARNAVVLGTSNKTELLLGYGTWYGDSACGINPLGDLYKAQVYQAAKLLGLPDRLIQKAPSADLMEGQTDEGDLGYTYAEMDRLLDAYIEGGKGKDALIKAGFEAVFVENILGYVKRNAYKRKMPKILRIGQKEIL